MIKNYNKLVRDNIPDIIARNGEIPHTRVLDKKEYKYHLEKKLYEEYNEVLNAKEEDRLEELADMVEVIKCLANLEGKTFDDVLQIAKEKEEKRGSFKNRIYLESVDE